MPANLKKDPGKTKFKICPICETESPLGTKICSSCEHEFTPENTPRTVECIKCNSLTSANSDTCNHCGHRHNPNYVLSFEDTLKSRDGYIVQGHEIDEDDANKADTIGSYVEGRILDSRDPHLINILKKMPKEQLSKLADILDDARDIGE